MKAILNLRKSIFYVAVVAAMFSMTSCDDDEEDTPKPVVITDINGTYKGAVKVDIPARATETPATTVEATVASQEKITFASYPIDEIVMAVEGKTKEEVKDIITAIGKVAYEIPFGGTVNNAKDSIIVTPDPKNVLTFKYEVTEGEGEEAPKVEKEVKVTMTKDAKINSYSKKTLKLYLVADDIKVNDVALDGYKKQSVYFELKKN